MLTSIIILSIIFLIPAAFSFIFYVDQKIDYNKNGRNNETYESFCKRNYTRYI